MCGVVANVIVVLHWCLELHIEWRFWLSTKHQEIRRFSRDGMVRYIVRPRDVLGHRTPVLLIRSYCLGEDAVQTAVHAFADSIATRPVTSSFYLVYSQSSIEAILQVIYKFASAIRNQYLATSVDKVDVLNQRISDSHGRLVADGNCHQIFCKAADSCQQILTSV